MHILNARNAIITADAIRALVTCVNRNLPDSSQEFPPIGPSVQIASRNRRMGRFRVVGHRPTNLIIENGKKLPKWPKYNTRLIATRPEDGMDNVTPPARPESESEEGKAPN